MSLLVMILCILKLSLQVHMLLNLGFIHLLFVKLDKEIEVALLAFKSI